MHFGTIGNKKSKKKIKLRTNGDFPLLKEKTSNKISGNNDSKYTFKKKPGKISSKKIFKLVLVQAFLVFFVLLFLSLRFFGSDNYYTIKRNEDLDKIARKFNVPKKILINLNNLNDRTEIKEGMRIQIPYTYDIYTAKPGDTLYNIARENGVKRYELAFHNKYLGTKKLRSGDIIHIPRVLSDITIKASRYTGLKPFKVEFTVETKTRGKVKKYRWDMGDGTFSNKKSPIHTYKEKNFYNVRLDIIDENNNEISSNLLTVNVRALANIKFTDVEFFEVNKGDIIDLGAEAIDNLGDPVEFDYLAKIEGKPVLIEQIGMSDKFKITKNGFANISIKSEGFEHNAYFFVSPKPSKFVSRPDMNWYKTQFKTGLNGNCGPACVAMSIIWANGKDAKVSAIRNYIGLPNESGAVGFHHLKMALDKYRIKSKLTLINNAQDIFNIVDQNRISIILFRMHEISKAQGNPLYDLFGTYYDDDGGHYVVVKGYSLDKKHFVVQDPMPYDWWRNNERYSDGISMLGRNRYYSVAEMMKALKNRYVLEIFR